MCHLELWFLLAQGAGPSGNNNNETKRGPAEIRVDVGHSITLLSRDSFTLASLRDEWGNSRRSADCRPTDLHGIDTTMCLM